MATPSEPPRKPRRPDSGEDDQPVLPDTTSDEQARGWGDEPEERDEQWWQEQRPPHWE